MSSICLSTPKISPTDLKASALKWMQDGDLIEWRIDLWLDEKKNTYDRELLDRVIMGVSLWPKKIKHLITLRSLNHGGKYVGRKEERHEILKSLLRLQPDFFDLELDRDEELIQHAHDMGVKVVLSHHELRSLNLPISERAESVYQRMVVSKSDVFKIALRADNACEALELLNWAIEKKDKRILPVAMGDDAQIGRILLGVVDAPWSYACLEGSSAGPGQLTLQEMSERYRFHSMNEKTPLLAVLGEGISHRVHNQVLKELGREERFLNAKIPSGKVGYFIALAKSFPFVGFAVTMPFKEEVVPLVEDCSPIAKKMGAVNTLSFQKGKLKGENTDVVGAWEAVGDNFQGKKVLVIGAGGVARSVIFGALERKNSVVVTNRTIEKAENLAREFASKDHQIGAKNLNAIDESFDLIVNCTSVGMRSNISALLPIKKEWFKEGSLFLECVSNPAETPTVLLCREWGVQCVLGKEMFIYQAIKQFEIWFGKVDKEKLYNLISSSYDKNTKE